MPIKINGTNTAANPSITGSDTDTGIVYGTNQIDFSTGGSSKVTLAGSDLGIGTTSPDRTIHCHNSSNTTNVRAKFSNGTTGEGASDGFEIGINASDPAQAVLVNYENSPMAFFTNATERMRVNGSDGKVGIGTTSPDEILHLKAANPVLEIEGTAGSSGDTGVFLNANGNHWFVRADNSGSQNTFSIKSGTPASSTHRLMIDSSGRVLIGTTSTGGQGGLTISPFHDDGACTLIFDRANTSDTSTVLAFENNNSGVGSITHGNSSTSYNTSSDYRLKENVTAISDGITRLKTLKPYRFNFKVDASTTVDGFLAHEVTAVPEAITGTKDETQDILYTEDDTIPSGKKIGDVKEVQPVYQGIDQSKLVPLLTAALQEAVGKIETLETKVAALEAV